MTSPAGQAFRSARGWQQRRANRRAVARFGEFWSALQRVGNALADADKESKAASDKRSGRRAGGSRHWDIATPDEVRKALRQCQGSLRICSSQAKRFEPDLIVKDWKR